MYAAFWTTLFPACFMGLAFCLLVTPSPAAASTFRHLSMDELVRNSDAVVLGTVVARQARFASDDSGRILTDVRVHVAESVLGSTEGSDVVVTVLGGEIGDQGQRVHGAPTFETGEEVVLFLQRNPAHVAPWSLVGLAQGAFIVRRGPSLLLPEVFRRSVGTRFLGQAGAPFPTNLPDLLDAIRSARPAASPEVAP
jgi:hypothetical protein